METKIQLAIACVIVAYLLYRCSKGSCRCKEGAVAERTWDDWDNYAKDNANNRGYWGGMAKGGGWKGSPMAPANDISGIGFGHENADPYAAMRNAKKYGVKSQNNVLTTDREKLQEQIRQQIMIAGP